MVVVGQDDLNPAGNGGHQAIEESMCRHRRGLVGQPGEGKFDVRSMLTYRISLPSAVLYLAKIDVEGADWVGFEPLLGRLVAFNVQQARNALALKAAMQGRSRRIAEWKLQPSTCCATKDHLSQPGTFKAEVH